jgi:palmitoyltransferase ZDHHC9/14/18
MFFSFVTTTGCLNVIVLATAIAHLVVLTNEYKEQGKGGGDAFVQSMQEEPISVALAIYSAAIVWFTVGLCLYHSYLILTNQTTYHCLFSVAVVEWPCFPSALIRSVLCLPLSFS